MCIRDSLIGGAGGDEILEFIGIEAGEFEENAIRPDIVFILACGAVDDGAALVEHAPGDDVPGEEGAGAARIVAGQIEGKMSEAGGHKNLFKFR